ncbi:MAG: ribosome recycling factor [Lewinella sp.]|jgi:ribosome recycling factor|uniref:ribosome recycling factor n=1 Tax=Lewinella sp. TaxID=2004506 RepID=UPI003D6BB387
MQEDIDEYFSLAKESMDHSIEHLEKELSRISTGKANPKLVGGLLVDYYGSQTPMSQVANIAVADARTITIQPWEKTMIPPIERSIFEANLGVTPQNDGELVRISIPPLTEDRRKQLVKTAKEKGEEAKVSIRSVRKELMDGIKQTVKNGYPEDAGKRAEDEAQKLVKSYETKVDAHIEHKEGDILTI